MSRILRFHHRRPGRCVLACVLVLASCGGTDAEPADDSNAGEAPTESAEPVAPDACALLTAEGVAEALGEPAGSPQPAAVPDLGDDAEAVMAACTYPAAASPKSIGVTAWRATNGMYTAAGLDGARQTLQEVAGRPPEEITGLGELAFWGAGQLHVVKDANNYFIVAPAAFADDAAARSAALVAARRILTTM
jgi:hypothetical protein